MTAWWRDPWWWTACVLGIAVVFGARLVFGAGAGPAWTALLLFGLVYPVLEELVFRGLLQPWLLRRTAARAAGPLTLANLLTSVLFSLAHLPLRGAVHATLVFAPSLVFGLFRDRHDSVLPAIGLHVIWNVAVLLLLGEPPMGAAGG
ncbi:MAG: JDVT-CTERM system CAAX-type protease [Gammaproteobacteria bacterium]|nr:MAG: JDVT-CTERM system CAAX-type protease [Gammaproteobacteria bacterium]